METLNSEVSVTGQLNVEMETPTTDVTARKRSLRKKKTKRNYDETLVDEMIEKHVGGKKKKIKKNLQKGTNTEAMLALSVGFPIDALLEEEIQAGVVRELGGKEQNDFIVVRNHIVAEWRENVRLWLSKEQIRETVSGDYDHLISFAYDFLLYNGHINFRVSPSFTAHMPEEGNGSSVIIIGAGLVGLAAAKQLLSFGFKVIILEGRNRPGGRVFTKNMGPTLIALVAGAAAQAFEHMEPTILLHHVLDGLRGTLNSEIVDHKIL